MTELTDDQVKADAYLAGGKPDPRHCAVPMPTDSKPVTWPDGGC